MEASGSVREQGYEDDRFEISVDQNFHCPICLNVLKNPVLCRRNQHHFCTACISRHLENSHTCPSCMEELSLETLSPAPRIMTSYLSELKIRCDYFSRGCPEFIQLGSLKSHTVNCGFSPVVCSNEGCGMEVNKQDRVYHESEVCEMRKVKCHDCVEMRKELDNIKASQAEMKAKLFEVISSQAEMKASQAEMKAGQAEMKAEMKASQAEVKKELAVQMQCVQDEILRKVETLASEKKDVGMKLEVGQPHQIMENIIVAGGLGGINYLQSVEIFDWCKLTWAQLQPMKNACSGSSSFVYKNQMILAGGETLTDDTDSMTALNISQERGQWLDFPARLPVNLSYHKSVVYKDRLLVVGGYGPSGYSNAIYEVLLVPPHSTNLLCRMPQRRGHHGVQLYKDSIVIVGGYPNISSIMSSIAKYDIHGNEYSELARLPFGVNDMATVCWGKYLIVLGGENEKHEALNTVILYDIEKNETHTLPSMNKRRAGCTAVVTDNVVVVMGGRDEKSHRLNSVEYFRFDQYLWQELPPMREARCYTTAVVKPSP